jgi:DNA-binding transcriptional LysR family regulator
MDLRDVQAFVALAEQRHFARAAASLGLSQPAFSARIKRLETALQLPLVRRGTRFQGLTAEGQRILAWARAVRTGMVALDAEAQAVRGKLTGLATIGVIPSALPWAGRLTAALGARHEALGITLRSLSSEDIQRGLDDFTLDAAITYLETEPLTGVRTQKLYAERYHLIANRAIGLTGETIGWAEAAALPLALLSPEMQYRRLLEAAFRQAGRSPRVNIVSNTFTPLISHVEASHAATIVPGLFVPDALGPEVMVLRLVDPDMRHTVGLALRETDPVPAAASAIWDTVRQMIDP